MTSTAPEKTLRNIRIVIEYDGTRYLGWQQQLDGPSIQAALMDAVFAITGERPHVQAAGRTDAGVHAFAQVANFQVTSRIPGEKFAPALNVNLPADINVHVSEDVPMAFNSRHDSVSKRYRYRVYNARERAGLEANRAWHVRFPLDLDAMRAATVQLIGEHDFESFRSAQCDAEHARRFMHAITVASTPRPPSGAFVDITFHANAFCRHMCRILAGTLVEVGLGRRPGDMHAILQARDRSTGGITAPPSGLTLLEVLFEGG
ncbi:MAG: tRNA pseudouridine(38-40) synthase TruA [Clostridia bacterium]|nr:tRNA pseudouridine(38-40) synthase TruA [Deltaproteobacteria bacterium]